MYLIYLHFKVTVDGCKIGCLSKKNFSARATKKKLEIWRPALVRILEIKMILKTVFQTDIFQFLMDCFVLSSGITRYFLVHYKLI